MWNIFKKGEKEIKEKLQSEIDIPEKVQKRVDDTLEKMTGIEFAKNELPEEQKKVTFYGKKATRFAAACLAAVLAVGGTAGAYSILNHFEQKRYGITDENKDNLKKEKILDEKNLKVTQNGVTVECVETVAAGPYAHVLLKVTVPESISVNENSGFDEIEAMENNKFGVSYCGGVSIDEKNLEPVVDSENNCFYYEFIFEASEAKYDGKEIEEINQGTNWDGQTLNLSLKNLAQFSKAEVAKVLVEGTWNLNIPMKAGDKVKEYQPGVSLSNGAVVKRIELTPISIKITYDYPRKEVKVPSVTEGENGEELNEYTTEYESINMPSRYELKDGTIKEMELGIGREGYQDEDTDQYVQDFSVEKILDLENITAIYIGKEKVELN